MCTKFGMVLLLLVLPEVVGWMINRNISTKLGGCTTPFAHFLKRSCRGQGTFALLAQILIQRRNGQFRHPNTVREIAILVKDCSK